MSSNNSITLKFLIDGYVRRISVMKAHLATYQALEQKIRDIDPSLRDAQLLITWKDDEDEEVLIRSDCELCEAVLVQTSAGSHRLRFTVSADKAQTTGEIEVLVKTIPGKVISLKMRHSDTIYAMKQKIARLENVPEMQQLLKFADHELSDDRTLFFYHILEGATLDLIYRMRGC